MKQQIRVAAIFLELLEGRWRNCGLLSKTSEGQLILVGRGHLWAWSLCVCRGLEWLSSWGPQHWWMQGWGGRLEAGGMAENLYMGVARFLDPLLILCIFSRIPHSALHPREVEIPFPEELNDIASGFRDTENLNGLRIEKIRWNCLYKLLSPLSFSSPSKALAVRCTSPTIISPCIPLSPLLPSPASPPPLRAGDWSILLFILLSKTHLVMPESYSKLIRNQSSPCISWKRT